MDVLSVCIACWFHTGTIIWCSDAPEHDIGIRREMEAYNTAAQARLRGSTTTTTAAAAAIGGLAHVHGHASHPTIATTHWQTTNDTSLLIQTSADNHAFDGLILSGSMFSAHMPNVYLRILSQGDL
jgi:hypothetical protein